MAETDTADEAEPLPEFYVPAMFQFSTEPGRIERVLVGLFKERGGIEVRTVPRDEPIPEFYVPAMFQFSTEPGRIERFLLKLFDERGKQEFRTVPEPFIDDFYLPATIPDGSRRHPKQKRTPLVPASESPLVEDQPERT